MEKYKTTDLEELSGRIVHANEFVEASSRLPDCVKSVTFVIKKENVMYKYEGDGGLIQNTVMAPGIQPRNLISEEEFQKKANDSIDRIHEQIIATEDIEIELAGLEPPKDFIPPDMTETTKDTIFFDCAMDRKYDPRNKALLISSKKNKRILYGKLVEEITGFALIGPAGSGKSTTLRKFVKDVIVKESKNRETRKLVVYIELKLLQNDDDISPNEAILNAASRGTVEPDDRDILIEWMERNTSRILFALDGYDQITKNITENDKIPKHGYRRATMSQYLHGLLEGKVFPGALVVLSTREYALQNIPYNCVPKRVIKLVGLSNENIDRLVIQMSNYDVLKALKESSCSIYFLCHSPLFLTLATWIVACMKDNTPKTKSGILMCIVYNFLNLEDHIHGRTLENLHKLCALALYGIKNSKIVFTQDEISRFDLGKEDLKDIFIGVPKASKYVGNKKKLICGNYQQYFLHQMFQEVLASLMIILMNLDEFDNYLRNLWKGNFEEVAQLTYGLLFRSENQEMLCELAHAIEQRRKDSAVNEYDSNNEGKFENLKDLSKHKTVAMRHLHQRLQNGKVGDIQMIRLLYESGDNTLVQNNVKEIVLKLENEYDCFCLGKVVEKTKNLTKLWLQGTSDDLVEVLIHSCNEKISNIGSLMIWGYFSSPTIIGEYYGKLSNYANKLELFNCKITKLGLNSFLDQLDDNKKFARVMLNECRIELEHVDGMKRLMAHIDGTLNLQDDDHVETYISSQVRKEIPPQFQGCTVVYLGDPELHRQKTNKFETQTIKLL